MPALKRSLPEPCLLVDRNIRRIKAVRIEFVDKNRLMTADNCKQAEENLLFALSRFSNEIVFIRVIVEYANRSNDKEGLQYHAQIKLRGLGTVEITDEAAGSQPGMANLANRLGRTVARRLKPRLGLSGDAVRRPSNEATVSNRRQATR